MDSIPIPDALKPYIPVLQGIVVAILILIFGWIASKWANRLTRAAFTARKLDEALGRFIASIVQYAVLAAAIISALGAVGIQTTSLVAVFASAGLAVGLALQGSLGNFASGVMILFFRPFNLGDKITAGGQTGTVEDIGLFATTLGTLDNETIIVPNSAVTGGSIMNFTAKGKLRGNVVVAVAASNDVGKVIDVLAKAAASTKLVLKDPAPAIAFTGVTPRGYEFTVHCWCKSANILDMLHNLRRSVCEAVAEAQIVGASTEVVIHQKAA